MDQALCEVCVANRPTLVDELVETLRQSSARSYRDLQAADLHARAWRLVDAFVSACAESPVPLVRHIEAIIAERIASGFALEEVQTALSLLEGHVWSLVVQECEPSKQVSALARATTLIGAAKDRLAQLYLEELQRQLARVAHCERKLDALFRGTADASSGEDA